MRKAAALLLATTVFASGAMANTVGPLAAGKPAGVEKAQLGGNGFLLIAGIAVVAGGIALVVSSGNSGGTIATSTTGTAP